MGSADGPVRLVRVANIAVLVETRHIDAAKLGVVPARTFLDVLLVGELDKAFCRSVGGKQLFALHSFQFGKAKLVVEGACQIYARTVLFPRFDDSRRREYILSRRRSAR